MPPCARSGSRCSRRTSTSRSSRTSSRASASGRSAHEVLESLSAGQQVVKIVNDELVALLSAGDRTFHLSRQPGRRRDGRPAGLGQDDLDRQARPPRRQARPPAAARRRGPVPAGRRGPARDARQEPRHPRLSRAGRDAGRRHRRAAASRPPSARSATSSSSTPPGACRVDEALMAEIAAVNAAVQPGRDAARRRRDDRPGGRRRGPGVRGRGARHRPDPDQDRRRRPRRRGAVDLRRHRRPGQVPGHRREDRRARGLPPGPPRRAGSSAWATS